MLVSQLSALRQVSQSQVFTKTLSSETLAEDNGQAVMLRGLGHSLYKEAEHHLLSCAVLLAAPLSYVVGLNS